MMVGACGALLLARSASAKVPAGWDERILVTPGGLERAVAVAVAPDGRIFIGEQWTGLIKVFKNGALLQDPFAKVTPCQQGNDETGLLGLALDPDFTSNGYLYAFVSQSVSVQRVIRYTAHGDKGDHPQIIIDGIPSAGINHNGGGIRFGPDGKLYVTVGDNSDAPSAQDRSTWKGKLLRFEKDGSIPADNPLAGSAVFATGLRNTFRICFQPTTGKIFGTENGPNTDDELNVIRKGADYGWPLVTGKGASPGHEDPIWTWTPTIAPVGCVFANGGALAGLGGDLLVADYKAGAIHRIHLGGPNGETVIADADFVTFAQQVVDVALAPDGSLIYCTLGGALGRVASGSGNVAPFAAIAASPPTGAPGVTISFDGGGSSDVDGHVVSWAWSFTNGLAPGTGPTVSRTFPATGTYTVTLTVTDDKGATGVSQRDVVITTSPANQPPSAHIESVDPDHGKAPLKVKVKGHGHDDGRVVRHDWDFGDGSAVQSLPALGTNLNTELEHTYQKEGTYTIKLTVTDDQGATGVHRENVLVGQGCAIGGEGSPRGLAPFVALALLLLFTRRRAREGVQRSSLRSARPYEPEGALSP